MCHMPIRHTIAPWVSWRNYRTPSAFNYRTLLSNEKTHEYLLLDGKSSEIWEALTSDDGYLPSLESNDVDEFIFELQNAGLLLQANEIEEHPTTTARSQSSESASNPPDNSVVFEREMMEWAWQHGFLFSAHLELTYRCNETCIHCYNPGASLIPCDRPKRQRNELDTAAWMKVISQLAEIGVFRLSLSGGEATLRNDFFELVAYARKLGFAVVIFTNGLNSNPAFVEKLAKLWPHSVEVSIYSATPELHDQVTGVPGSFYRSIDCLHLLHIAGVRIAMKTILMGTTVNGYGDCERLAKSLGASLVMDTNVSPNVDGRKSPINLNPTFDTLVELAMTPGSPTTITHTDQPQKREAFHRVCGAGTKTISINPEGDVTPCTAMPWVVGAVRDRSLTELWRSAIARRNDSDLSRHAKNAIMRNEHRDLADWQAITLHDFNECGKHEHCNWCEEICPGDAFVLSGTPFAPVEHRCKAASARMTAAEYLSHGQDTRPAMSASPTLPLSQTSKKLFRLHADYHGFGNALSCKTDTPLQENDL